MSQPMLHLVVFLAIAALLTGIVLALADFGAARRAWLDRRLPQRAVDPTRFDVETASERPLDEAVEKRRNRDWFERLVSESGVEMTPAAAMLAALGTGIFVSGSLFIWRERAILSLIGLVAGPMLVVGWLMWRRARATRLMREQFPEAISLLARAVQAGESIEQAMRLVSQYIGPPLAVHFRRCVMHFDMGLSVEGAVRAMASRMPLAEGELLASTLIMQRRAGGSLARTLESLVSVVRDRLSYQRHFRAATAAPRMSAYSLLVAGLMLPLLLGTSRPEYMEHFINKPFGLWALGLALLLYACGAFTMWRILRHDY